MPERTLAPEQVDTLASELRLACMRIARRARFASAHEIAPHQFSVLCRLEKDDRTPRELATIEQVSAPSMSRTVAGLVARHLVARQPDPGDGRQVILSLTPDGREALRSARAQRDAWMMERFAALTPDELRTLDAAAGILAKVAFE